MAQPPEPVCDPAGADTMHVGRVVAEVFVFDAPHDKQWRPVCIGHLVDHCMSAPAHIWRAVGAGVDT